MADWEYLDTQDSEYLDTQDSEYLNEAAAGGGGGGNLGIGIQNMSRIAYIIEEEESKWL